MAARRRGSRFRDDGPKMRLLRHWREQASVPSGNLDGYLIASVLIASVVADLEKMASPIQ